MSSALRLIFTRSRSLGSALIRAWPPSGSWSHCGVLIDDATVVESLALRGGVVATPLAEVQWRSTAWALLDLPCENPEAGRAWCRSLLAEPGQKPRVRYDWWGALGIPLREQHWADPTRAYCSHKTLRAIDLARLYGLLPDGQTGVTPNHLFGLCWAAGGRYAEAARA